MKHIVGFSGGIDSQAAALWVRERFADDDIILLNSNTGENEHPLTTAFLHEYCRNVFPVVMIGPTYADFYFNAEVADRHAEFGKARDRAERKGFNPDAPLTFAEMMRLKGRAPSRRAQFCTGILKLNPAIRWIKEQGVTNYVRYSGLRRDESDNRKNTPRREYDDWFRCEINHPLHDWSKQACFDFVLTAGEQVNPLYSLGFDRVGCEVCINSGRKDIRNWAKRFPEVIVKIRGWEKAMGRTFFAPMVPGKEINWIDEVVEWANCERGGRQYSLDVYLPAPVCESKFGLCG